MMFGAPVLLPRLLRDSEQAGAGAQNGRLVLFCAAYPTAPTVAVRGSLGE